MPKRRRWAARRLRLEGSHTNAVFVASCEANKIDDIIVEVHNAGLELVTIHDRPEGSDLGSYHYVLEVESKNAITDKQLKVVEKFPEIRSLGSFDVMEKRN